MSQGFTSLQLGNIGKVVQTVRTVDGAYYSSVNPTAIPIDDTIPQNTEGFEVITRSITPVSSANLLRIDVLAQIALSISTGSTRTALLFQDSAADALASSYITIAQTNAIAPVPLTFWMTAGTVAETTFKLRIGTNATTVTVSLNGFSGARVYGGTMSSFIAITEYEA